MQNVSKIQAIVQKYNLEVDDDLQKLEKELSLKLKFLELAHPKINFSLEETVDEEDPSGGRIEY